MTEEEKYEEEERMSNILDEWALIDDQEVTYNEVEKWHEDEV